MPFFTSEQLGPKQSVTPDGYLLCEEVPIARIGEQLYGPNELPLKAGSDMLITVKRVAEDVFRPETMASFEGKPATMGHPDDFVTPLTWNELAVGHAQNVRRGEGVDSDLLIADLLITNADAIVAVRDGLREVSCGYEADYEEAGNGVYFQRNIIGNHVALVEHGRAGSRCAIQDEEADIMKTKDNAAKKPSNLFARLLLALRTKDEGGLMDTLASMDEEEESEEDKKKREDAEKNERAKTGDALTLQVASLAKTVDALVGVVKKMTKDDLGIDDPLKTGDDDESEEDKKKREDAEKNERAKTGDALRDAVVKAEIITPGFSMPTRDSVTDMKAVLGLQRRVLSEAMKTEDGKKSIAPLLSGRTIDAMSDDAVAATFNAAAVIIGAANSSRGARGKVSTKDFGTSPKTPAEINAINSEFWGKRI